MGFESQPPQTDLPDLDEALAYYKDVFEGDDVTEGSVLDMAVGDSGYSAYWAVQADSANRYWLSPLSKLDEQPSDNSVLIDRTKDGYVADFTYRIVEWRDQFYDYIVTSAEVDSIIKNGRFYGLPLVDVIGAPHKLPGYFCDENGQPPSPGKNGEFYAEPPKDSKHSWF